MKKAPVSGVESLMDYHATLIGEHRQGQDRACGSRSWCRSRACARARRRSPSTARTTSARTSPSRAQAARAHVDRGAHRASPRARPRASCTGILKRPDEKYVTERAYDNPKFVEDMVRDVAVRLNATSASPPTWWRRELRVDPQSLGLRADRARQERLRDAADLQAAPPASGGQFHHHPQSRLVVLEREPAAVQPRDRRHET